MSLVRSYVLLNLILQRYFGFCQDLHGICDGFKSKERNVRTVAGSAEPGYLDIIDCSSANLPTVS